MAIAVSPRDRLMRLAFFVPDAKLSTAIATLEALVDLNDPFIRAHLDATVDDEPESPDEAAAVASARQAVACGELVGDEEIRREFGLS